ncbi:tyrosine-type recombinase/integrase [Nannocystis sp.]|uniref:tyrosine-type recombinase/integrase n=1 Tax=Nannocystis sp. TaxID=1962667 RepID=UPI0025F2A1DD|nr:tyrosine-type recombinase/integrase [Nannocystis sp.]MBK7823643.1 tyrosine-type recombinase/integrase [Nannocystis sp.]
MLTAARIREAKPRSQRYEIGCDALPGFLVRVLPTGKKVFFVRYRGPDGKDRRDRLGLLAPGFGVDEARREALTILAYRGKAAELDPPLAPPPPVSAPSRAPERAPSPRQRAPSPAPERAPAPRQRALPPAADRPAPLSVEPVRAPATGLPPVASQPQALASLTLREFAERFIEDHIKPYLKPVPAGRYQSTLRRIILPALGDRPLDEITTTEIQRLHNSLRDTPCAANHVRCVLCCMYSKADHWGLTTRRNPVKNVSRFRENSVERYLSADERERLDQVLRHAATVRRGRTGYLGQEAVWAIRLLALTGMRKDEIRNLTWPQVDWQRSMLRLPDSKTGKRDVVVSDEVMDLLRTIAAAKSNPRQGLVVCSRNHRKLHSLGGTWLVVRRLADLGDMRLHDLRHSVASDAIMDGVPLEIVGKMLGHRNYTTTQRYAHIADTVLRDAVNRASKKIVRAAEDTPRK